MTKPSRWWGVALAVLSLTVLAAVPRLRAHIDRFEHPPLGLAPGRLLVAPPGVHGPDFDETLILLVTGGTAGWRGLVVNRPPAAGPTAGPAAPAAGPAAPAAGPDEPAAGPAEPAAGPDKPADADADRLWQGGPLSRELRWHLGPSDGPAPASDTRDPLPGLRVYDASHEAPPGDAVRTLRGYAAWYPGQLEAELAHGGWIVVETDAATILGSPAGPSWAEVVASQIRIAAP